MAGVRLSEITSGLRTIKVPFGSLTISVTYRMSERTPAKVNEEFSLVVIDNLVRWVDSWDIVDDDDQPVPITEEGLSQVPYPVLKAIFHHVAQDNGLGEAASSSDAG